MRVKEGIAGRALGEALANDIQRFAKMSPVSTGNMEPGQGAVTSSKLQEWLRAARESATQVGAMPPASATLRARLGAMLVRIVQRMLFWYTPQIIGFNTAAVSVMHEQASLIEQLAARVRELGGRVDEILPQVGKSDQELLAYIRSADDDRRRMEQEASKRDHANESGILQLRTMLFGQERRLAMLLAEARKRLPGPMEASQVSALADDSTHDLDSLYLMLEDHLRGSREEIQARLQKYVPRLLAAQIGTAQMPLLDIGCGRGEWLEILRDHGLTASGVDLNRTFVDSCQQSGLDVSLGDALANLRQRPDRSLGAVTGFHLVEHLPWPVLVELMDETVRVLKPGGIAIFETPNPDNFLVGSRNFYNDPTHRNPLPSLLLAFLVEARGLCNVEVLPLHPCPDSQLVPGDSPLTERFNAYFYGPQDYAVIGRKV